MCKIYKTETSGFTAYSTPLGNTHIARFIRVTADRPYKANRMFVYSTHTNNSDVHLMFMDPYIVI